MKSRDYYFDNLKAFLIICVIIGNSLEYANPTVINPHYFILILYIFHMPLFAFVSGYFCKKSSRNTQDKVVDIFKVYIGAQLFYFLLERFFFKNDSYNLELFSPSWTMWYLLSLIFWYILSDFIKDKKKWFIISIFVALYIGFDNGVGSFASISRTFFFLPFFIGGMLFDRKYIDKLKEHRRSLIVLSSLVLLILYCISEYTPVDLLFEYTKYTFYYDSAIFPFVIRIFHYISAFIVGALILTFIPSKKTSLYTIGANSLIMYVTHSGVIKILYKYNLIKYNTVANIFISEIIILITVILITFLYTYIKKSFKERQAINIK